MLIEDGMKLEGLKCKSNDSCDFFSPTRDTLSPKFVKPIIIDYYFETAQELHFLCYDIDDVAKPLEGQDFIGEVYCRVADIVSARSHTLIKEFQYE